MATFRRSELLQKEDMQRRKSKSPMSSMTKKSKIMSEKPAKKLPEKRVMRKKGGKAKRMCK